MREGDRNQKDVVVQVDARVLVGELPVHVRVEKVEARGQVHDDGEVQEDREEDGDNVHVDDEVDGEVDGDLEEVQQGEEHGDAVEVEVEGHGDVEDFHEVEEDVNCVEGVVEDQVHVCSWSTSTDECNEHENNECLEGLVDVSVQCDVDGDIDVNVEVEVEVESLKESDDVSVESDDHDERAF
ncbi:hypothetical protein LR48_Vigan10g015700 [Vigna angularis]|uniref:Uncharacterized protein n=1 Tax=Phaseolus angularis TaxID=3914 RepID=A0A0L9VGR5_PHAAN|nr:hypothetical protein LR48_Vigan10g015700 [Vigna angularis]